MRQRVHGQRAAVRGALPWQLGSTLRVTPVQGLLGVRACPDPLSRVEAGQQHDGMAGCNPGGAYGSWMHFQKGAYPGPMVSLSGASQGRVRTNAEEGTGVRAPRQRLPEPAFRGSPHPRVPPHCEPAACGVLMPAVPSRPVAARSRRRPRGPPARPRRCAGTPAAAPERHRAPSAPSRAAGHGAAAAAGAWRR